MTVIILESVTPSLRGELTRWLIEPHVGVFVGHVSALVRDKLWEHCCKRLKEGGVVQLWSTNNEQRFDMRMAGNTCRRIVDLEGLKLIQCDEAPVSTTAKSSAAKRTPSKRSTTQQVEQTPETNLPRHT